MVTGVNNNQNGNALCFGGAAGTAGKGLCASLAFGWLKCDDTLVPRMAEGTTCTGYVA